MYSTPTRLAAAALSWTFSTGFSFRLSSLPAALLLSSTSQQRHLSSIGRNANPHWSTEHCGLVSRTARWLSSTTNDNSFVMNRTDSGAVLADGDGDGWRDLLPMEKGSHNSSKIMVPESTFSETKDADGNDALEDPFDKSHFRARLEASIQTCRELGKTSIWAYVPMNRAGLLEDFHACGLRFHHAFDETAVLNLWLTQGESKIPDFATHNVGVGAVVINSRDEILCVREQRRNYMPWKTPTGLTELGEHIDQAVEREVLEETGVAAKFHSVLGFRQTHGLTHGRSDLFFVCRLDPVETRDTDGNVIIPDPIPEISEIECAEWIPLPQYRDMVFNKEQGHPMMQYIMTVLDAGAHIEKTVLNSVVPGRKPNDVYYPSSGASQRK